MTRHQLRKLVIFTLKKRKDDPSSDALVRGFLSNWSVKIDSFGIPYSCKTKMRSNCFDKIIFRVLTSEKGNDFCPILHAANKAHGRNRYFLAYYEDHMSSSCFKLGFHE